MACFLVDYENRMGSAPEGLLLFGLNEKDEIIFFYRKASNRITMELHRELETGMQNALVFQLSSYLGACIIHQNSHTEYYIVSKDSGYDCVCSFWKNRGFC